MNSTATQMESSSPSGASPVDSLIDSPAQTKNKEKFNEVLHALALPFELAVVQWRVTEWSDDGYEPCAYRL